MNIYLISSKYSPKLAIFKFKKKFKKDINLSFVYLGKNFISYVEWEKYLSNYAVEKNITENIEAQAKLLNKEYLELIFSLGKNNDTDSWWGSRISECNTLVSNLFLNCCYLNIASTLINSDERKSWIFISDSNALLRSIHNDLSNSDYGAKVFSFYRFLIGFNFISNKIKSFYKVINFIKLYVNSRFYIGSKKLNNSELILIHTYISNSTFNSKNEFTDIYYPYLYPWLKNMGYAIGVIPMFHGVSKSYHAAWQWLDNSNSNFINTSACCNFRDYYESFIKSLGVFGINFSGLYLREKNVTKLFNEEREISAFDTLESFLYLKLPLRLKRVGLSFKQIILEYENMIPEKMLITGFRRWSPATKLVGFLHGGLFPHLLCNQIMGLETSNNRRPDKILCNSQFFTKELIRAGVPGEIIHSGPALRQGYLLRYIDKFSHFEQPPENKIYDLLVVLPLMIESAVELILRVFNAIRLSGDNLRIAIKTHPMQSELSLLNVLSWSNWPAGSSITSMSLNEAVNNSKLAITMNTTAIVEILLSGTPLIVIQSKIGLFHNPMHYFPLELCIASNEEELERRITQITRNNLTNPHRNSAIELEKIYNLKIEELMNSFIAD